MPTAQWIDLLIQFAPEAKVIVQDIIAVFQKHPQIPPAQIMALASVLQSADAADLALIAADQASHPAG